MEKITAHQVYEGVTSKFSCVLVDEDEAPIDSADIDTLTVTLYSLDDPTFPVINNRNAVNVKGANGGVLGTSGAFSWQMTAADNAILNPALDQERHMLRIDWTYDSGDGVGVSFQKILVKNTETVSNG